MKKTLFTATLLAASLMAASTVQAAPQEVTMWHYFDQKPEQEMLADMVEEYNSLQDDIHINATFVSRTELMNQYTVGALSGELPDIGQVDSPDMESYISLGVFEDITDELESWGELDQFYDGPLDLLDSWNDLQQIMICQMTAIILRHVLRLHLLCLEREWQIWRRMLLIWM